MAAEDPKQAELAAVIREIQDRVRARYPVNTAGSANIQLADLTPVLHARDRAEGKVAAIGSVNPRPPGFLNSLIQSLKRALARGLNWLIRDQIEFNRATLDCVQAIIEALNESNRSIAALAAHVDSRIAGLREELQAETTRYQALAASAESLARETRELKDIRAHWSEWRKEWERKLSINEVQFLRGVADLQTAFQHRATLMESNFRELASSQHKDFTVALDSARIEIQQRLWRDVDNTRAQFEKLIHNEIRVLRQHAAALIPVPPPAAPAMVPGAAGIRLDEPLLDSLRFADRFRGSEAHVKSVQQRYLDAFRGCEQILDIGCGRGEFLEILRDSGKLAKGIDSNAEMAAICRSKGLYAEQADLFHYLGELEEASLDGIFCAQLIEHLPPHRIPELISLAAAALRPSGCIVIETPDPACLAIFATHFYLDPTHSRPIPAPLLCFYLEEAGFGSIRVDRVNPADATLPAVSQLPEEFRAAFFGGLDYAVTATRL